ncbi:related to Synchronized import protein 1 [Saccharomycodes ludwigii]|uniref:Related to Synchronized import protein 1 n=1 Tax=Saccharomycodes ludwigii TaxID=36035 RepID=A0A376B137_9ASCO|nr:related to Synchronized import protein 1 [Saccharomycodes ludwigii]
MGRSKKRSRNARKLASPLENNNKENEAKQLAKIMPLLQNLQSVVPNEKTMALSSISLLCEDPHWRQLFLKQKIINIIMAKLINDSNTEIVVDSMGLLRNLCIEEGYDVCTYLYRLDVWITIKNGLSKVEQSINFLENNTSNNNNLKSESIRLVFAYADNLISLIVALSNGNEQFFQDIINSDKLELIFQNITKILSYGVSTNNALNLKIPINLFNSILDLLYSFSSESLDFIDLLGKNEYLSQFIEQMIEHKNDNSHYNELTCVLIEGLHLQLLDLRITLDQACKISNNVCSIINNKIDITMLQSDLKLLNEEIPSSSDSNIGSKIKELSKKRESTTVKVQAIELGMDVITAILEILGSQLEENPTNINTSDIFSQFINSLPAFLHKLYTGFESATSSILTGLKTRILICWNNYLWVLLNLSENGVFDLPDSSIWKNLLQDLNGNAGNIDEDGFEVAKYGCLWALLKSNTLLVLREIPEPLTLATSLITLYKTNSTEDKCSTKGDSSSIELKQRLIGCLACLGKVNTEYNTIIGDFFINELLGSLETEPILIIDLLNSIFDIYGDASYEYDSVNFVEKDRLLFLESVISKRIQNIFKLVDKNKDPGLKTACTNTLNILNSFVRYKKNEGDNN